MNRYARIVLIVLLAFVLSSCGDHNETGGMNDPVQAGVDATSAAESSAIFSGSVQGGSFTLPFDVNQRYDRWALTENTKRRQRQVLLETVGIPAAEVLPEIRVQLESIGYKGGKVVAYRGGDRQYFRKTGHDEVAVLVRARGSGGPELKDPAATASIYMTETAAKAGADEGEFEE